MQALGEHPDLLEHALQVPGHVVQSRLDLIRQRGHDADRTQVEGEGDDPLLDSVMEIALDAAPRLVAGRDDASA